MPPKKSVSWTKPDEIFQYTPDHHPDLWTTPMDQYFNKTKNPHVSRDIISRYKNFLKYRYTPDAITKIVQNLQKDVSDRLETQKAHTSRLRQEEEKRFLFQTLVDDDTRNILSGNPSKYYHQPLTKQSKARFIMMIGSGNKKLEIPSHVYTARHLQQYIRQQLQIPPNKNVRIISKGQLLVGEAVLPQDTVVGMVSNRSV